MTAAPGTGAPNPGGSTHVGPPGTGGNATGGNVTNARGSDGIAGGSTPTSGQGGGSPPDLVVASAPHAGVQGGFENGNFGIAPGGGGSGGHGNNVTTVSAGGGSGSYCKSVFRKGDAGAPAVGAKLNYAIGNGGASSGQSQAALSGKGANGRAMFTYLIIVNATVPGQLLPVVNSTIQIEGKATGQAKTRSGVVIVKRLSVIKGTNHADGNTNGSTLPTEVFSIIYGSAKGHATIYGSTMDVTATMPEEGTSLGDAITPHQDIIEMWFILQVGSASGSGASVDIGGGTLYLYTTVNKVRTTAPRASAHGSTAQRHYALRLPRVVEIAIGHGATVPLGTMSIEGGSATGDANQDGDATILVTFGIDEGSPQGDSITPGDYRVVVTSAVINEGEAIGDATAPADLTSPFE